MTAEKVVKNTTKGLADLIDERDGRRDAHRIPGMERNTIARFGEELQKLEERFADRTRELETGFNQGFESLRRLHDQ